MYIHTSASLSLFLSLSLYIYIYVYSTISYITMQLSWVSRVPGCPAARPPPAARP